MDEREQNVEDRKPRKKRIPLGVSRPSLSVPEGMMDKDYHYHWINDNKHKPTRLYDAEEGGYTFVKDKNIDETVKDGEGKGIDSRISRFAGTNEDGTPYRCYLMRIKRKWYDEDQVEKQRPLDELEQQLKGGIDDKGGPGDDTRYIPRDGIKIEQGKEQH